MEGGGDFQQGVADQKKEKPRDHDSGKALGQPENFDERRLFGQRQAGQFFEAGGTNHAVIMFGDAFAAEELAAFRATRHRFAGGVVEAALMEEEILHGRLVASGNDWRHG